ncbi:MAG: phytanoyl-CoA dioxygenase family protein [Myxococcales bacterium]|nr:phytanoyl-CoA dioxygenase family protein [Myxococcales bacterium]
MSAARDFFREHGYWVARRLLPRSRVLELEAVLDAARRALPPAAPHTVWELPGLSRVRAELAEHARDPRIAAVALEVLDASELQLLQDTALVKAAEVGGEVAWHQDHTYTGYLSPPCLVSARLALTRCTTASGCLHVIDGSHHWGPLGELRPFTDAGVADALGERARDWADHVVAIELQPGDVSFHHCLTLHRSGANTSSSDRKTLITRLFDASAVLCPEHLPEGLAEHFPTRAGGRLDLAAFPLVLSRRGRSGSRR